MADQTQDENLLQQIEREVRMQEGAYKLLAACSQRDQALEASKSLLTCNARILALLSQLQRRRKAQILERVGHSQISEKGEPCTGKVSLSDLRIPLMWKDSEYFKNKGELHRCAVFCLLKCGTEIHDTDLLMVDRTSTDICFEDTVIFNRVGPGFQLRAELYSSCAVEDFSLAAPAPRRMSFLGGSLGCSSGRKIRAAFESAAVCGYPSSGGGNKGLRPGNISPPLPYQSALGPKYNLLAHTTLSIEHVRQGFKTHDLTISATEDSPFWLPLYGRMCCRLVAQPLCMIQTVISGPLNFKFDNDHWESFYCVLIDQTLLCYRNQEGFESKDEPLVVIPITKETSVCMSDRDPVRGQQITIRMQPQRENETYKATTQNAEDLQCWNKALQQHVYNLGQWKQCCDEEMKIEVPRSKKSKTMEQGSLFQEIVTHSSQRKGSAIPDFSNDILSLLSSYYKKKL